MTRATSPVARDEIYSVPIDDRWMLYSPRTRTSALVNRAAVDAVARCAAGGPGDAPAGIRELLKQLSHDPLDFLEDAGTSVKLVVIPTRACNMSCVYCDFGADTSPGASLDPRLACALFDEYLRRNRDSANGPIRVHFFGGEPLVARKCVETIIHYARAACARIDALPWFEITTNGLFDEAAVPFLGDYVDSLVVSVDGDELTHDRNRRRPNGSGTFREIAANLRRLAEYPVDISLRVCVTEESVDRMSVIAAGFAEDFRFDVLCFEPLSENQQSARAGLRPPDPYRFAVGVLRVEQEMSSRGIRVVHGPSECMGPRRTSCPLGTGALMLGPEGELTACYLEPGRFEARGMDLRMGSVDAEKGVLVDAERVAAIAASIRTKPRCVRCFCRFTCAGGCHVDQTPPGCSSEYDDRCRSIRMITAVRLQRSMEGAEAAMDLVGRAEAMRAIADNPDDRLGTASEVRP